MASLYVFSLFLVYLRIAWMQSTAVLFPYNYYGYFWDLFVYIDYNFCVPVARHMKVTPYVVEQLYQFIF
jgi:hypothetical protein